MKKVIAFDLDGTLAKSKSCVDEEMANLLEKLLEKYKVCIISGGSWDQFENQLLSSLRPYLYMEDDYPHLGGFHSWIDNLKNLYLMPTSGASLFEYYHEYDTDDLDINRYWNCKYQEKLTPEEVAKIYKAFYRSLMDLFYDPYYRNENVGFDVLYGQQIENRETQVTFSALGQKAPLNLKEAWDPKQHKRKLIIRQLKGYIPQFEIRYGGTTSIDVTKKGIDKAFGMRKLKEHLKVEYDDILFVGDSLQEGGNDYAVKQLGIECCEVNGPEDTKKIIKELLDI